MAFSKIEKENIKKNLLENCEKHWSKYGYKKQILMTCAKFLEYQKVLFIIFLIRRRHYFMKSS
ncbi:hypothetical protein SLVCU148_2217 [Staphylococcus lugdunensis VCU148]|nr:hypothetical protein SLVCU148_2217 [Staphylococcus lugdunensis VCU148]